MTKENFADAIAQKTPKENDSSLISFIISLCIILGFFYLALNPRYMKRISHLDRSKKDYSEEIQESFIHMNQMDHHFYAIAPRIHVKEWVESVKENVL